MNASAFALISTFSLLLAAGAGAQTLPAATPEVHCSLLAVGVKERAAAVPLIIEGEVLESQGFRGTNGRIYTSNRVRVYKLLKGQAPAELTLLTEGGTVGLDRQDLTNTLSLVPGQQGVFFLEPAAFSGTAAAGVAYAAYASLQGFVRYDVSTLTAAEPFRTYSSVDADFYQQVAPGTRVAQLQANPTLEAAVARRLTPVARKVLAPVISFIGPLTVTAGTGTVLTITGTGFGTTRGSGFVEFRNADDGGATYTKATDADIVSWTDNRIQVLVPSLSASGNTAGTGPVRVTTTDQQQAVSPAIITVVYAATNVQDDRLKLRTLPGALNQNKEGGYSFRFDPNFASNALANAAWQRALANWRCQTGVNWVVGDPRTKGGVAEDGENAVGFDTGTELPTNVLGRTTSYYRGCYLSNDRVSFYVQEIDTQFDSGTNWQYGPANPSSNQIDFESVALHELGHAQQLSHLILPSAVMHYAVARGQVGRRLAAVSDIAGGRYVLRTRGFVRSECSSGSNPMLPAPVTRQLVEFVPGAGTIFQWITRDECFVTGYVVERASSDTTAGWQAVGTVAAGAANGTYRITDPQPRSGLSYYRLRVRRPDNSLDSAVPLASTDDASAAAKGLVLYPNPIIGASTPVTLQYQGGASSGKITVLFYDAIGRYQGGTVLNYEPGLNILPIVPPLMRAGLYIARWSDSNGASGRVRLVFAR
ncbi:IPT/TIG domain-containing protein [Hymenobacter gelipurpurascens]|uniref:IPT/TIG domain-containing protein n=1 Tax=Hymenobacter gelipurpurascens TaxID=89968 RepID=A0A212UGW7_9BACT|nr:matrixin family metalloprotease [Hymenobacter gelipurpurascens]SNC77304.1 IPT/TIG domain-containing protein [Hymenobacter gelipurpurascens]